MTHTIQPQQQMRCAIIGVVCAIATVLSSCSSEIAYSESSNLKNEVWPMADTITFNTTLTKGTYDIDILVRSTEEYQYQNIWFFVETLIGDSIIATDTIQGFLSDNYGRRLGQGIGSKLTDYVHLSDSTTASDTTTFTYRIRHGMRIDTLPGISDIGITIKQTGN